MAEHPEEMRPDPNTVDGLLALCNKWPKKIPVNCMLEQYEVNGATDPLGRKGLDKAIG